MRLLQTATLTTTQHNNPPPYAILSHTWGDESSELSFQDLLLLLANPTPTLITNKPGYTKVTKTCHRPSTDGLDHVWIDSCCIDKTSSAELSGALNSMYYWYQQAEVCYAYLVDVPPASGGPESETQSRKTAFSRSRWFTRGWTLQELIAPKDIIFLDSGWNEIGTKAELKDLISEITGVPVNVAPGGRPGPG